MANSTFWKLASIAFVVALFYLAHSLSRSGEADFPRVLATAVADDQNDKEDSMQWAAVDGPNYMPQIYRAKVEDGWLVIARNDFHKQFGLTFVPDQNHSWRVADTPDSMRYIPAGEAAGRPDLADPSK